MNHVQISSADFDRWSAAPSAWLRKLGGPLNCSHYGSEHLRTKTRTHQQDVYKTLHPLSINWCHPHVINAIQIPSGGRRHHPYPRVVHKRDVTSQHHCEHQVLLQSKGHTWSCSWHWKRCVQKCLKSNDSALRLAYTWTIISWKIQLSKEFERSLDLFEQDRLWVPKTISKEPTIGRKS